MNGEKVMKFSGNKCFRSFGRFQKLLIFCVIGFFHGCNSGEQRGEYAVTGFSSERVCNGLGKWIKLRGSKNDSPDSSQKTLINIVAFDAQSQVESINSDFASLERSTFVDFSWEGRDSFELQFEWERIVDDITIGEKRFSRSEGTIFIIALCDNGNAKIVQLYSEIPDISYDEIVELVEKKMHSEPDSWALQRLLEVSK
jgi:hypothetical protein